MIRIQASVSKGWLHKEGGFTFDAQYYMDPFHRMKQDEACHEFVKRRFPEYPLYNMEDNLVQAEYVVPRMMVVGAIQPNMIIAAALGAEFMFSEDKDSDVRGFPLKEISDPSQLPGVQEVLRLPFIKKLEEDYIRALEAYPDCVIIPPFFWDKSGRATIHGIITTSMKFIGADIFTMMLENPDLVMGIHDWITDVYIAVIHHFASLGNMTVSSVHVGECSGTMLDESSYRTYVTPYISRIGREFGAVRLHSCGNSDHIIEPICEIENVKVIDTGSDTSLGQIRQRMGQGFEINVFPPLRALQDGSPRQEIQTWLERTLQENKGGNLKIAYHLEPDYDVANCLFIHEELDTTELVKKGRLY
jgi:hypothetical protein